MAIASWAARPKHRIRWATIALVLVTATGCGGQPTSAPPPAPSSTIQSATAEPTPTRADDQAAAEKALITAAELGKPWVAAKKVNSVGTDAEACPGQPTTDATVKPLASARADFTRGRQTGAAIAVFGVWTYASRADVDTYRATLPKVLQACARYIDNAKMHVQLTPSGTATIDGAETTWRYAERVYYDAKHTKLAYARHYVIAQQGRTLTSVQYAFLTDTKDPLAKDFSVTEKMARTQFAKVLAAFDQQ
ncbi:MAG TPA: hypothetical protein VFP34_15245 [Microlunatus sp.]|nr:hypothetical protein [Microlunatus sp.]